jgi:hypothetical protein
MAILNNCAIINRAAKYFTATIKDKTTQLSQYISRKAGARDKIISKNCQNRASHRFKLTPNVQNGTFPVPTHT